jgi:tetratricopeptide (TPR) repeat protein
MTSKQLPSEELWQVFIDAPDVSSARALLELHTNDIDKSFLQRALDFIGKNLLHDVSRTQRLAELGLEAARLSGEARYASAFLGNMGLIEMRMKQYERARVFLIQARSEALKLANRGERQALPDFVAASTNLVQIELQQNEITAARQILAETRLRCRELNAPGGELWANLNLGLISRAQGNLDEALQYARLTYQQFTAVRTDPLPEISPPDISFVYDFLEGLAANFYYDHNNFDQAGQLARWAVDIKPDGFDGYYILGLSQLRLQQNEASLGTWQTAITLEPSRAFLHTNYAAALWQLGRFEEALTAISTAIQIQPDEPRYYFARGKYYQYVNRHAEAIADFGRVIELARQAKADALPATPPAESLIEYERNLSPQNLADGARRLKIDSHIALGQIDVALAEANVLISEDDTATQAMGYGIKGKLYRQLGQVDAALESYSARLTIWPNDSMARQARVVLYLSQDHVEQALGDLAVLADEPKNLSFTLEHLNALIDQHPALAQAYKWRGFAYFRAIQPSRAEQDLTKAITIIPNDGQLYYWRGLTRITHSELPKEDAWNKAFHQRRVRDAIEDLGMAALLEPDMKEALVAFKWLVDRTTADGGILETLVIGDPKYSILIRVIPSLHEYFALPSLHQPAARYWRAFDFADQAEWLKAIDDYQACQAALLESGLPIWATRLHLNIADNYLRLYEPQIALDHLAAAEKALFMQGGPLSRHLLPQADEVGSRTWQQQGLQAVFIEPEYQDVYGVGFFEFTKRLRLLKAQALARTGDSAEALKILGDSEQYLRRIRQAQGDVDIEAIRAVLEIVKMLRDAGQLRSAAHLLREIEPYIKRGSIEQLSFLNLLGTVAIHGQEYGLAQLTFEQGRDLATHVQPEFVPSIDVNIAGTLYHQEQHERALEILQTINIEQMAQTQYDEYLFYALLGQVLAGSLLFQEAQDRLARALAIADSMRTEFDLYETRISWQSKVEDIYQLAVLVAAVNHDAAAAFDFVERSRARALVDQLAAGYLPLPPSAIPLAQVESTLLDQRERLIALMDSYKFLGASFVDYEALRELQTLGFVEELVETPSDGSQQLSIRKLHAAITGIDQTLVGLRQQMEQARLATRQVVRGDRLSLPQFQGLLSLF